MRWICQRRCQLRRPSADLTAHRRRQACTKRDQSIQNNTRCGLSSKFVDHHFYCFWSTNAGCRIFLFKNWNLLSCVGLRSFVYVKAAVDDVTDDGRVTLKMSGSSLFCHALAVVGTLRTSVCIVHDRLVIAVVASNADGRRRVPFSRHVRSQQWATTSVMARTAWRERALSTVRRTVIACGITLRRSVRPSVRRDAGRRPGGRCSLAVGGSRSTRDDRWFLLISGTDAERRRRRHGPRLAPCRRLRRPQRSSRRRRLQSKQLCVGFAGCYCCCCCILLHLFARALKERKARNSSNKLVTANWAHHKDIYVYERETYLL